MKLQIQKVIEAIKAGFALSELKGQMDDLQARTLLAQVAAVDEPPPLLHPSVADLYREKVEQLVAALERDQADDSARQGFRGFLDKIVIPHGDGCYKSSGTWVRC